MLEIAGGIIIAAIALCALPFIIMALPWLIALAVALVVLVLGIDWASSLDVDFTVFCLAAGFLSFAAYVAWLFGGTTSLIRVRNWEPTVLNEFIAATLISVTANFVGWAVVGVIIIIVGLLN